MADREPSLFARQLGARMRAAARGAGLTQEEVGRALGMARHCERRNASVSRWYSGQDVPGVERLREFARLVGQPAGWFFGEESRVGAGGGRREEGVKGGAGDDDAAADAHVGDLAALDGEVEGGGRYAQQAGGFLD